MYRDRTKIPKGQNVRNGGSTSKAAAHVFFAPKVKEIMNKKVKSPLLKEIAAHADVSSILKEPGDTLQEDIGEDSFNPPLHSTAVYTDDDELPQTNENPDHIPAKLMSPVPPVVQKKSIKPNSRKTMNRPAKNTEHNAHRPDTAKPRRTPKKNAQQVPEQGAAKKHGTPRNMAVGPPTLTKAPNITSNRNVVSDEKSKTQRKEQNTSRKKKSRKDKTETVPGYISSPENMPKSVRSVNELDVVNYECGKLIESYREKVETDVCKKAVDLFCQNFKEQISTTISDLQKLKALKRKNAKIQSEIGRKRKRLLEVKNEIIAKQPELSKLQKEYSELEQKQESLKSARAFLDNLSDLQDDYKKFKAKKPHIKETYGMSSLPALCLEAENIMKPEQHFQLLNRQLQSLID